MKIFKRCLLTALGASALYGATPQLQPGVDFLLNGQNEELVINNRILLKVNGKPISVLDVVKKMDLLFYRQFPQFATSSVAKFQFYLVNWKPLLFSTIDDQMILADAEEKQVEITDGDIREELEKLFGPNVVLNIDKLDLSYDEAWKLLKDELTVRRMNMMMVRSKAMNEIHPKKLRELYEKYLSENPGKEEWVYKIVTVRSHDEEKGREAAFSVAQLTVEEIEQSLSIVCEMYPEVQVMISEEYKRSSEAISESHKKIVESLTSKQTSEPVFQEQKGEKIFRIFCLLDKITSTPLPFNAVKDNLHHELFTKSITQHTKNYIEKLRERYGLTEKYLSQAIPEDFEPFALR
jgi:hypothetical protein